MSSGCMDLADTILKVALKIMPVIWQKETLPCVFPVLIIFYWKFMTVILFIKVTLPRLGSRLETLIN